jgi:DNA-binding NarL/FixJ family response regulator
VLVEAGSAQAALRIIAELAAALPDASVIAVGLPEEPMDFLAVVHGGAVGYLDADVSAAALARAVRSVAAGGTALPRQLTRLLAQAYRDGLRHPDEARRRLPAPLVGNRHPQPRLRRPHYAA